MRNRLKDAIERIEAEWKGRSLQDQNFSQTDEGRMIRDQFRSRISLIRDDLLRFEVVNQEELSYVEEVLSRWREVPPSVWSTTSLFLADIAVMVALAHRYQQSTGQEIKGQDLRNYFTQFMSERSQAIGTPWVDTFWS